MRTMKVFKNETGWLVKDSDPKVVELFGTDTLPTAFTPLATPDKVLSELRRLNPDAIVSLA